MVTFFVFNDIFLKNKDDVILKSTYPRCVITFTFTRHPRSNLNLSNFVLLSVEKIVYVVRIRKIYFILRMIC